MSNAEAHFFAPNKALRIFLNATVPIYFSKKILWALSFPQISSDTKNAIFFSLLRSRMVKEKKDFFLWKMRRKSDRLTHHTHEGYINQADERLLISAFTQTSYGVPGLFWRPFLNEKGPGKNWEERGKKSVVEKNEKKLQKERKLAGTFFSSLRAKFFAAYFLLYLAFLLANFAAS